MTVARRLAVSESSAVVTEAEMAAPLSVASDL